MPDYFLRTPRLGFREWSINDLSLALDLWGDPGVSRFLGGPYSREAIEEKLTKEIATLNVHQIQYWPIFLLANNDHVGCAGLRPYKPQEKIHELGYHLRRQYWGMGLAEEAGRAVVNFAFENLGAKALFAGHHPQNLTSRRGSGEARLSLHTRRALSANRVDESIVLAHATPLTPSILMPEPRFRSAPEPPCRLNQSFSG